MEGRPPPDDPFDEVTSPEAPGETGPETGPRGSLAEGVKKAILAGVGALFMTEESARRLAREWKLPKEVAAFIGQQAQGAKDEVLRVFADEFRRFLESDAVRGEFFKTLSGSTIEIRAEIRVRPDADGKPRPVVNASARARRPRKAARRP